MSNLDFLRNAIIGSVSLLATVAFLLAVVFRPCQASASDASDLTANKIIGTWRLIAMTYQDKAAGKETDLRGKDPIGFFVLYAGGKDERKYCCG